MQVVRYMINEVIARREKLHAMLSPGGDSVILMFNNKAGDEYCKGRCNYYRRTGHKESQCRTRRTDKSAAGTTSKTPNGRTVAP